MKPLILQSPPQPRRRSIILPEPLRFPEENQQIFEKLKALDWDALFLTKSFPTYPIDFKNSLSVAAKVLVRHWIGIAQETNNKKFNPSNIDILGWSSQQI